MKFRDRRYTQEVGMEKQVAFHHPLIASAHRHKIISMEKHDDDILSDPLSDALGVTAAIDPVTADSPAVAPPVKALDRSESTENLDDPAVLAAVEWESYRASIMQRFTSNDTIKVSSNLDIVSKRVKGRSTKAFHIDELDDFIGRTKEDEKIISQEEYVTRLRELNDDIAHAWLTNERVAALRLAMKVAKLLSDTSIPKFYPILFILVTDIMETIGSLVWKRIKGKAELNDNGEQITILSKNFTADDICQEAKDTCNNWFYKIGSIRELLPRIYLEISILHCMRFLENEPPKSAFQRLMLMIRGIADPLAAAYVRIYLARKGQSINLQDTGCLMMGLDDYLLLFQKAVLGEINTRSSLDQQSYARLMEPIFELYIHYMCQNSTKEELLFILKTFCDKQSGLYVNLDGASPVSVVVHYLIKELPPPLVASQVMDLSKIIKSSNDTSKPQYMNYKLLGQKLCECNPPAEVRFTILNDIWKVVSKFPSLIEYLMVADVFTEYILCCCSETELHVLLRDVEKHLRKAEITDDVLQILESIIMKVVINKQDLKRILDLPYFVDILDEFFGEVQISVYKKILHHISRSNQLIPDPVSRHFVFELNKSLYKSLDSMSSEDEKRQLARLISRSVQLVKFEHDLEQHLMFLVEWRGIFVNCDLLRETIAHVSNRIAMAKLTLAKGKPIQYSLDFIKACLTFNEVTIPCINDIFKRAHLFIETAEVALMTGLVSRSESLLRNTMTCLEETRNVEGMEIQILGCIQKLCSFLIIVPGNEEQGTFYLLRSLVQLTQTLLKGSYEVQAILGVIMACHALSQENLPYHVKSVEVVSNDDLFAGESSYKEELGNFVMDLVKSISPSSDGMQGGDYAALLIIQTFVIAFELEENSEICNYFRQLVKVLEASPLKYQKHISYIDKFLRARLQGQG